MSFQIKDFVSIAASMINHAKATQDTLTDFRVGSVSRTLMEAPAVEIEELYLRMLAGIVQAIPAAIYQAFNFPVIDAAPAHGIVRVTFSQAVAEAFTIPAGFIFEASATKYTVNADMVVPLGATAIAIAVTCTVAGAIGNVKLGAIDKSSTPLAAGALISNDPITSGRDRQTDDERKQSFTHFIESVARGTPGSVSFAARQARITDEAGVLREYVTRSTLAEGGGRADVYLYGSAGVPSAALLAKAQRIIDGYHDASTAVAGYRPVGVKVTVRPMVERSVDIGLQVRMLPGFAGSQAVIDAIRDALTLLFDVVPSGTVLRMAAVVDAVLTVPGVHWANATNNENVVGDVGEVLRLGATTVAWLGA